MGGEGDEKWVFFRLGREDIFFPDQLFIRVLG